VIKPVKLSISPGGVTEHGGGSSINVFVYGTLCNIKSETWSEDTAILGGEKIIF
jgi:hypothetical protein